MSPATAPSSAIDAQIQFVRHNFDNHQSLIRFADTKAGAYVTLLVFLGASGIPLAKDAVKQLRWIVCGGVLTSGVYCASGLLFIASFLWTVYLVYRVIRPRGARHYVVARKGHDLLFYDHVLLHSDNEEYFNAVAAADGSLLLRNLTDQVFELAHICREKMHYLRNARLPIFLAFFAWVTNLVCGLRLVRWGL